MRKDEYLTRLVVSKYSELGLLGLKQRKSIQKRTFLKRTGLSKIDYHHKFFKGIYHGRLCYCRSVKSTKFIYVYVYTV